MQRPTKHMPITGNYRKGTRQAQQTRAWARWPLAIVDKEWHGPTTFFCDLALSLSKLALVHNALLTLASNNITVRVPNGLVVHFNAPIKSLLSKLLEKLPRTS